MRVAKVPGQNSFMVASVALAADGRTVLAGYERGSVLVWDLSRGEQLATLPGHSSWIGGVALSDDGRVAVTISRGSGYVWNLADRRSPVRVGAIPRAGVDGEGLDLSADGRTAMIGGQLWNLSNPARPTLVNPVAKEVDGVSLSSDGQVALTTDGAGSATLWRIADPARPVKVAEVAGVGELDLDYLTMYDVKESPGSQATTRCRQ
ncbi:WD40 repeat domain-containing protein [Nonomuraea dietziae]|uniref:WD40 repeat domain-containing protein n=1 Tax=Nonomuraea dietziae TaxID=65515 RepID=UPI0031E25FB1